MIDRLIALQKCHDELIELYESRLNREKNKAELATNLLEGVANAHIATMGDTLLKQEFRSNIRTVIKELRA
jgi:hypothetical protein